MRAARSIALPALLALLGAALPYALFGDVDLNLADEGFLWYGVERVLRGDVPLRDFQAYDPGRYYWCAAWSPLFGSGILGVRAATAVFQALGLFLGALACRRLARTPLGLIVATAVLWAWMFPRHKLFEPALALAVVYTAVRLIESFTPRVALVAGALTGFLAWFGRNHALYAGVSFVALGALLAWKLRPSDGRRLAVRYVAGVALGAAPLLGMLALVPGFASACLESIRLNLHHGANLALPYPWPWTIAWAELAGSELFGSLALALAFLLPFLVLPIGLWVALRTPREDLARRALALAATFVGATYVHHVAERSGVAHLAQCIHPLWIAALALPACSRWSARTLPRALVWTVVVTTTALAAYQANPMLGRGAGSVELTMQRVRGEELRLAPLLASSLRGLEAVVSERVAPDELVFLAPTSPGLYPVLAKRSPSWWIYFFWPAEERQQRRTIEELEERAVRWALIDTSSKLDGRAELRFANSNALVWEYLTRAFEAVSDPRLPQGKLLLRRREDPSDG